MPYPLAEHRWSNSRRRHQGHAGPSAASTSFGKPKPLSGKYALKFLFYHCPKFLKPAGFEGGVGIRDPAQYDIFEDSSDIEFGASSSGVLRFDKSNINSSVDSVLSTSGQKFKIEGDNLRLEDDSGINDGAVSFNEDDFTNALKIIQQVWAEAVNVDVTFVVLNAGNREFIGIRDRKLQRLYLSPLIDLDDPSSLPAGYFKIHTGLQIAAVLDAIERAKRLNALSRLPVLHTFEYDRGD
ncbi:hypothetical protein IW262DRAFT_482628 [Armillaria fumosa]|nr:hypothetical protein IW262DRAFT_482628 [Armillaria fumosa]